MEKNCKKCHNDMIPSAIGWLCPKCGNVEKMTATQSAKLAPASKKPEPEIKTDTITLEDIKSQTDAPTEKKDAKSRVKAMFAPEIANRKQIMEEHLLSSGRADEEHMISNKKNAVIHMPSAIADKEQVAKENLNSREEIKSTGSIINETAPLPPIEKPKKHRGLLIFVSVLVLVVILTATVLLIFVDNSFNLFNQKDQQSSNQHIVEEKPLSPEQIRDNQRKKDLREIADGLAKYFNDKGGYPAGADIRSLYPLQYSSPIYISYINYDPSSTDLEKIKYDYVSNGRTYILKAKLEDINDKDAQNGYFVITSTQ